MNEAKKWAERYMKAKMDYGEGAGIKRRHINAELDKKLADPEFAEAFGRELMYVDTERIVRETKAKNRRKAFVQGGKKAIKTAARAGAVAAGGYAFYTNNRESIDRFVGNAKIRIENAINRHKYKKETEKVVNMMDVEKANAYLKSIGFDYTYK